MLACVLGSLIILSKTVRVQAAEAGTMSFRRTKPTRSFRQSSCPCSLLTFFKLHTVLQTGHKVLNLLRGHMRRWNPTISHRAPYCSWPRARHRSCEARRATATIARHARVVAVGVARHPYVLRAVLASVERFKSLFWADNASRPRCRKKFEKTAVRGCIVLLGLVETCENVQRLWLVLPLDTG